MKKNKKIINIILIIIGTISLVLGSIGIILPLLPTTPFFMLTLVCYAKGSKKFEKWFLSTKIYKKYLEKFLKIKAMTNGGKIKVLVLITLLISIPIILVNSLHLKIMLVVVILGHYIYFIFKVKSLSTKELDEIFKEIEEKEKAKNLNYINIAGEQND